MAEPRIIAPPKLADSLGGATHRLYGVVWSGYSGMVVHEGEQHE